MSSWKGGVSVQWLCSLPLWFLPAVGTDGALHLLPKGSILCAPTHQSQRCRRGRDLGTQLLHADFVLLYFHWNDLHNTNVKGVANDRVVFRRGKKVSGEVWDGRLKMCPVSEAEPVKVSFKTVRKSCCSRYDQISYLGVKTSLKNQAISLKDVCFKAYIPQDYRSQNLHTAPPYKTDWL